MKKKTRQIYGTKVYDYTTSPAMRRIGSTMRREMKRSALRQMDVARRSGLGTSTIFHFLNGRDACLSTITAVAKSLGKKITVVIE